MERLLSLFTVLAAFCSVQLESEVPVSFCLLTQEHLSWSPHLACGIVHLQGSNSKKKSPRDLTLSAFIYHPIPLPLPHVRYLLELHLTSGTKICIGFLLMHCMSITSLLVDSNHLSSHSSLDVQLSLDEFSAQGLTKLSFSSNS